MNLLNEFAARYRQGDVALPANCVTFAAICVDDTPKRCRLFAQRKWPHLAHFWVEAAQIAKCRVAFVPNRCVVRCADRSVVKWWDGSHGNVLQGPARRVARERVPVAGSGHRRRPRLKWESRYMTVHISTGDVGPTAQFRFRRLIVNVAYIPRAR